MIKKLEIKIDELNSMKKYPKELYFIGNLELLKKRKVSIVGSRRPNSYTKTFTHLLSLELSKRGVCIVSGGAMGVDAIAHNAAKNNTIMVAASGLDIKTPSINRALIENIEQNALVLGQYKQGVKATKYSFVVRNELVVALGEILIITEANLNSGSLRSASFAIAMGKEIYVLSHRINESKGTNNLLANNLAKPIYNLETFVNLFGKQEICNDDFLEYCKTSPNYNEAVLKFGNDTILTYELDGKIRIYGNNIILN